MSSKASHELAAWNPYDQNSSAGFFDPEWMFGVRDGFRVVIGNPPYVRIQALNGSDTLELKTRFAAAARGNFDLYVVFVERGLQLLHLTGQLAFILPHKFFNAQYGAPLRALLAEGRHLRHVVHFGDQQIFPGATNYVCLLFLTKIGANDCRWVKVDNLADWLDNQRGTEGRIPSGRLGMPEWNFVVGAGRGLFDRLQAMPVKLGSLAQHISQGIRTSANEVYVLDVLSEKDGIVTAYSKQLDQDVEIERRAVLRFLRGREIRAYSIVPSGKIVVMPYRLVAGRMRLLSIREYRDSTPLAWAYLKRNKRYLEERENGKMKNEEWYSFIYPKNLDVMLAEKLLVPDIADRTAFAFDEEGDFAFTSGYGITLKPEVKYSPKYLLALLNSRLLDAVWKQVSTPLRGGFYRYFTQFIEQLPVYPLNLGVPSERAQHDALAALVTRILSAKKADPEADTSALEREIDELVYELYGLTKEEIALVEGASVVAPKAMADASHEASQGKGGSKA